MTLPATALYALLASVSCGLLDGGFWPQFCLLAVSAYSMMVLNNAYALVRVYSRMVSCSYLALFIMAGLLTQPVGVVAVQLCMALFYLNLFRAYQDKNAMGVVFYSFLAIGVASVFFVQVLFFVPVLWILLFTNILAGNIRTFLASVLGLIVPYWFVGGYYLYYGKMDDLCQHFIGIAQFEPLFSYSGVTVHQYATFALLTLLALVGIVHFHRNSYKDKIRTRMFYETFMVVDACTMLFLVLQPQHYNFLIGLMTVNTAPLIAHFIALTRTKLTNVAFLAIVAAVLALTIYNVWMPSLTF